MQVLLGRDLLATGIMDETKTSLDMNTKSLCSFIEQYTQSQTRRSYRMRSLNNSDVKHSFVH